MNVAKPKIPRWLMPFTRVTSGTALLSEVDGLRFLAIASVLLFHIDYAMFNFYPPGLKEDAASRLLHHVLSRGNFGVPLFFAISGFILMLPFARAAAGLGNEVSLSSYFLRRITRLEPPYVICMSVLFVLTSIHFHQSISQSLPHFAASLAYLHNVIYGRPSPINEVAWSLEIEVQFYCLAPLIAKLFKFPVYARRIVMILISIACCSMSLTGIAGVQTVLIQGQYFLAGVLCADLYLSKLKTSQCGSPIFNWIFLVGILMPIVLDPNLPKGVWLFLKPVSVFALLIGVLESTVVRRIFRIPIVYVVGGMCYTIYLWHSVIWLTVWHRIDGIGLGFPYFAYFLVQSLLLLPCVLGLCAALFLFLERPFMVRDWPRTLMAKVLSRTDGAVC